MGIPKNQKLSYEKHLQTIFEPWLNLNGHTKEILVKITLLYFGASFKS